MSKVWNSLITRVGPSGGFLTKQFPQVKLIPFLFKYFSLIMFLAQELQDTHFYGRVRMSYK